MKSGLFYISLNLVKQLLGTESRNRTGTPLQAPDFESGASTSSAIPAIIFIVKFNDLVGAEL